MPFSQISPSSPSPTESKRLIYTSVSLLLSRTQGYCYHLSKFHIYALVYCIGVFLSGLLHSDPGTLNAPPPVFSQQLLEVYSSTFSDSRKRRKEIEPQKFTGSWLLKSRLERCPNSQLGITRVGPLMLRDGSGVRPLRLQSLLSHSQLPYK